MCEFCEIKKCTLTKQQVLDRGPIIEVNAYNIMQGKTDEHPQTYSFKGVPCYNSYSALIPDENEEDPHLFIRFSFDEDEGYGGEWESQEIAYPLEFPTEKEFLKRINGRSARNAWELANVKLLAEPIPAKGRQRLWNWEDPA